MISMKSALQLTPCACLSAFRAPLRARYYVKLARKEAHQRDIPRCEGERAASSLRLLANYQRFSLLQFSRVMLMCVSLMFRYCTNAIGASVVYGIKHTARGCSIYGIYFNIIQCYSIYSTCSIPSRNDKLRLSW